MMYNEDTGAKGKIRLMILDPGHFHAALIQKNMIDQVDPEVYVYAPEGRDVELHLERIHHYNNRRKNPANWQVKTYKGPDYLEQMLTERPGNVMITAGSNRLKTKYLKRSVDAEINVLSDKPMAIDKDGWNKLVNAFKSAEEKGVLIYDIMTERKEIACGLQRRLALNEKLFGVLKKGSANQPAIIKESVHHLYKEVSGYPLRRPPWYFDVRQQGEGIVDVTAHLVDLSMWCAFPEQIINYDSDIKMLDATRWPTHITRGQFETITDLSGFPDYLNEYISEGVLSYYSNGDIRFTINDHYARVCVTWDYQAPTGGGDTHFSVLRGTKSDVIIRQGKQQDYKATLYVEPSAELGKQAIEHAFSEEMARLQKDYPGISYKDTNEGWELIIPDKYYLGHETHFLTVAEEFYQYLIDGNLPVWEVPNMITKYYITTQARELALYKN